MSRYFNFRIVDNGDGTDTIDRKRITPESALTLEAYQEYVKTEIDLYISDRKKQKEEREAARNRKIARNPLYKLVALCGMI